MEAPLLAVIEGAFALATLVLDAVLRHALRIKLPDAMISIGRGAGIANIA